MILLKARIVLIWKIIIITMKRKVICSLMGRRDSFLRVLGALRRWKLRFLWGIWRNIRVISRIWRIMRLVWRFLRIIWGRMEGIRRICLGLIRIVLYSLMGHSIFALIPFSLIGSRIVSCLWTIVKFKVVIILVIQLKCINRLIFKVRKGYKKLFLLMILKKTKNCKKNDDFFNVNIHTLIYYYYFLYK